MAYDAMIVLNTTLDKPFELGITTKEMYEIFAVTTIVGETIVVPHTRRSAEY